MTARKMAALQIGDIINYSINGVSNKHYQNTTNYIIIDINRAVNDIVLKKLNTNNTTSVQFVYYYNLLSESVWHLERVISSPIEMLIALLEENK